MPQKPPSPKAQQQTTATQSAPVNQPDEARMSEIAKRLLSTPPDRPSVGKAVTSARKAGGPQGD